MTGDMLCARKLAWCMHDPFLFSFDNKAMQSN
jgi:hypothetical protein